MTLLEYPCKGCGVVITYPGSFRRYFCSEKCFVECRTRTCVGCHNQFLSTHSKGMLCEKCYPRGMRANNEDRKHPLYRTYVDMIYRCYNPARINYKDYGGRGIRVCQEWLDSMYKFAEDVGPRPNGTTLDRIDNTKGYSAENCRWATVIQQRLNRRRFKNSSRKYKGHGLAEKSGRQPYDMRANLFILVRLTAKRKQRLHTIKS